MAQEVPGRVGGFVVTYTGRRFWPLDPRPDELDLVDIARALAFTNRWRGHIRFPYSVAQHSELVSLHVPRQVALAGLLHDAPEAFLGDLASPIKGHMPEYRAIEDGLWRCVATRFGLPDLEPPEVKEVDRRIATDEALALFPDTRAFMPLPEPLGICIRPMAAEIAFNRFLRRYAVLTGAPNVGAAIERFRSGGI